MRVLVWGMGYVGSVTAAALARLGHEVIGVEPNQGKVAAINGGSSPVREPGIGDLLREQVAAGRLRATDSIDTIGLAGEVSLICVGTPTAPDGTTDLSHLETVIETIGRHLPHATERHVVAVRSTVPPGTARRLVMQKLNAANAGGATRVGVAVNPEFLREGTALADFERPSMTVIGVDDDQTGDVLEQLYAPINAPVRRMTLEEAELLKLVNNAFHALKTGFANEVGRLCDRLGIDSHQLMDAVVADTRLNISAAYLRPGFAFGGSCLPKDLRSLGQHLRLAGAQAPILEGVLESNRQQVHEAVRKIKALGVRRIAILGLAFKSGTDDLRESPIVDLVNALWGDGYDVRVHDPDVDLDEMVGANRTFVERQLPQVGQILASRLEDALDGAELIVVAQRRPEFARAVATAEDAAVLDLVRIDPARKPETKARYVGLSW